MTQPEWIAADWGMTHLRLWAMRGAEVMDHRRSDQGADGLARADYPAILDRECAGWGTAPLVICGSAGAREGWVEAPYAPVPTQAALSAVQIPGRRGWIICGVSQTQPADAMRGEETQIAGLLAARPDFDGVVCLPGTQTKWARVSAGEICHFQSFLTGELFDLLSHRSVLRHSVGAPDDMAAFDMAVQNALSQPHRAYGALFGLRADALLHGLSPGTAGARLSGTLIGWELAAAKPYWLGAQVVVIGAPALSGLYTRALSAQGVPAIAGDADVTTLAGLHRAWCSLCGQI